jgi:hypothetical protein
MNPVMKFGLVLAFVLAAFLGAEPGERQSLRAGNGFFSAAEAIVGRPLTPVSVAGVARRTVRRCAVGVYNC